MKNLIKLVLSLAMVAGVSSVAFAADEKKPEAAKDATAKVEKKADATKKDMTKDSTSMTTTDATKAPEGETKGY
jgi:hypothetical protein